MQTNSANGHHQHKGSVKILMPGTFPCRLDMEICACGATRWVDQNRTPATPWQFINRRTSPIRKEDARVAPRTSPQSALEGLITCGSCGKPMVLDDTQGKREASYACQPGPRNPWVRCPTPRLHALRAEILLARTALRTVLTDENICRVLLLLNDPQRYDTAPEYSLTRKDVQQIREHPKLLVLAADSTQESRTSWAKSSPRYRSTPRQQSSATPSRCRETALWRASAGRRSTYRRRRSPERDGGATPAAERRRRTQHPSSGSKDHVEPTAVGAAPSFRRAIRNPREQEFRRRPPT